MIKPPILQKGDKIAITCPAKALTTPMIDVIKLLETWGLEVVLGDTIEASFHQFSGTDELRAQDMQTFINDTEIKAIIAARGGYGCIRIVDEIDWTPLLAHPKWIIGFSDITIFHLQLQSMGLQSLHAQMPSTIKESSLEGLESLRKVLFGEGLSYQIKPSALNRNGKANGTLIGGNLSLLVASLGSTSDIDYSDKILFIEDVGEYLYAIDRLIRTLDRAGKLAHLKGLIVGGFTAIKDNDIPFGFNPQEIINSVVSKYHYPICYDFPAGHIEDNRALIFGRMVNFEVSEDAVNLIFL
jgi:muramoyltetrapeptide carboxypeptidase